MPEADNTNMPRPKLPSLQQVEAEGEKAVQKLARAFVRDTLRTGGRIDLARLERAGPSVQAAYRRLLAQAAARLPAPPRSAPAGKPAAEPPVPWPAPAAAGRAVPPRIEKGWRDRCRPAVGFEAAARRRGLVIGAIVTALALAIVFLLQL